MKKACTIRFIYILILACCISSPGFGQERWEEDPELVQLIGDISWKAYGYFRININLDSAEFYYKEAIDLAHNSSNYKIDYRVSNNYISLASLYRKIYNNSEAINYLNEAERILRKTDPFNKFFATIFHNKGNIYKVQNDLYRTKEYYEYALDFLIRNGYQNTSDFAFFYSNYLELLYELEEFELVEEKLSLIDINRLDVSPLIEFRIHNTYASLYSQLGKYNLAKKEFEKAQRNLKYQPSLKEYTEDIISYYYNVIGFNVLYNEYDEALKNCDKAFIYIESLDPLATKSKIIYRSNISYRASTIHYRQGNLDKSLWIVNNTIKDLDSFLSSLSIEVINNSRTSELATPLPDLYVLKSRALFSKFNRSNDFEDLVKSYEAYQKAIEILNYMKLAMRNEDSRVFATSQILEVYTEAVYVGTIQLPGTVI
jgi:tetratricopeptide (TPR) repeat protein